MTRWVSGEARVYLIVEYRPLLQRDIYPSIYLSSIHPSIHPLSIFLSIHLSIHPSSVSPSHKSTLSPFCFLVQSWSMQIFPSPNSLHSGPPLIAIGGAPLCSLGSIFCWVLRSYETMYKCSDWVTAQPWAGCRPSMLNLRPNSLQTLGLFPNWDQAL